MFGMTGEQLHAFITAELLELPRHMAMPSTDCIEFGSNYHDMGSAAMLLSHSLWCPGDYAKHDVRARMESVAPCTLRRVTAGTISRQSYIDAIKADMAMMETTYKEGQIAESFLVEIREQAAKQIALLESEPRPVFVKFELGLSGRTARDMREMNFLGKTRRIVLDRRYEREYQTHLTNLMWHYLEAKE